MAAALELESSDLSPVIKRMELIRCCGSDKRVLVITSAERIPVLLDELRQFYPLKLIGTLEKHEWMYDALDVLLATPRDACLFAVAGRVSTGTVSALLLDHVFSFDDDCVRDVLSAYWHTFGTPCIPWKTVHLPHYLCPPPPRIDGVFLDIVKQYLPEAASCPGFLDPVFCDTVLVPSAFEDWSGVVASMPGLLRGLDMDTDSMRTRSLVLAPQHRTMQLRQLLEAFACYMGLPCTVVASGSTKGSVFVDTPEVALRGHVDFSRLKRVLIVEANNLVCAQVKAVLNEAKSSLESLHLHSLTEDGFNISGWETRMPKAITVLNERVVHHHQVVASEASKVDVLGPLWKQMWAYRLVVFCNDPSKVGEELVTRGFRVHVTTTDMDTETVRKREAEHIRSPSLLVTNKFFRSTVVVVNLSLPCSAPLYLERFGMDRTQACKLVINLVTEAELQDILAAHQVPPSVQLPAKVRDLHRKFHQHMF